MDFNSTVETLLKYSKARIPLVNIVTIERRRALNICEIVCEELTMELPLSFYVHTMSKGMFNIANGEVVNEDQSIMGALDFIVSQVKHKENLTFIFTEVNDLESDNLVARYFYDVVNLVEENGGMIIVLTKNNIWHDLQRLGMAIKLDLPNENEMLEIINNMIKPYENIDSIKIHWNESDFREAASILTGISSVEVKNVICSLIATRSVSKQDLEDLKFTKDKLFSNINGLEKIPISRDLLEVGGLAGLKKWLSVKKKLQSPEKRDQMKKMGMQFPNGILFVGVPGCGKSLSAKAIAADWKLPLYRLDFATIQGKYVGQSEQQLKEAFNTAEHVSPCVLWIDEIEKGLSGAGTDSSGVTNRLVGQFLFWMQECTKNVFVVATANDVTQLPSELLRRGRFDEIFFIDLPNEIERKEILSLYIKKYLSLSYEDEFLDDLVVMTNGFTGADIESAIREIAYRKIADVDFVVKKERVIESIDNLVPLSKSNPEKINFIREWGKERALPASGKNIISNEESSKISRRVIV